MAMPYLIDGYNLMHALGLMRPRFGPGGLRKARRRFLSELAYALGPSKSAGTTIVFDASRLPEDADQEGRYKGLRVIYAIEDDDADSRIELLLDHHASPRDLTIVSTDHRLRLAARRRGARSMTADDFAMLLQGRKARHSRRTRTMPKPRNDSEDQDRQRRPSAREAQEWLAIFGDLDAELASDSTPGGPGSLGLSDADIRRIESEVEDEAKRSKKRWRKR